MKDKIITIDWKPDKVSGTPIYKQIMEYVSGKVGKGHWTVGARLPSQRKLAELFQVNRSTVITAMEELISYGILETDYGGGTKVSSNTWSLLMESPPDWNHYITSGHFRENHPIIQKINKLEFDPAYERLGTGELDPALFPKELMQKVMSSLANQITSLNYLGALGLPQLRKQLALRLRKKGLEVSESNILISSGSLQALQLISVAMLKPGSVVFTEAPTYLKSLQVFQSAGMKLMGIPMDKEGIQYWNIKNDSGSLLYTIPTHHNPTGRIMSQQRRKEILHFCEKKRIPLIEDDAYGELWLEEEAPAPIKSMDHTGTVLYLGTISKTLAPGLRIGWVAGPEPVIERLGDIKMQVDYGASSISQWIAAELLAGEEYDNYLNQLRKQLRDRRDNMLKYLELYFSDIAEWEIPAGGFYIWCRFRKSVSMNQVFYKALQENILLNPGNIYDFEENYAIRLSYAYLSPEFVQPALRRLRDVMINTKK